CKRKWTKFKESISAASQHAEDVEGSVGESISQMTTIVFCLGRGFYQNWNDLWEDKSGKDSISQQQMSAQAASRELETAMGFLNEIFLCRKSEIGEKMKDVQANEKDEMKVDKNTMEVPDIKAAEDKSMINAPETGNEEPMEISEMPIDNSVEIKQDERTADNEVSDIKPVEESMEISEKPIDNSAEMKLDERNDHKTYVMFSDIEDEDTEEGKKVVQMKGTDQASGLVNTTSGGPIRAGKGGKRGNPKRNGGLNWKVENLKTLHCPLCSDTEFTVNMLTAH
ncbi:hypothetical protein PMAYCL1PPCAC_05006, partial [Pristionchus mayeri]